MIDPHDIERYVKSRPTVLRGRDIGRMTSWTSIPIVHLGPDGRMAVDGQRFERFRMEFSSGYVVGGIVAPGTEHFALQELPEDEDLSAAIARAGRLGDDGSELAIFEAADYAAVGVIYLSGGVPLAVTVKPDARDGVPIADVIARAYGGAAPVA